MKFRTITDPSPLPFRLKPNHSGVLMGSCFSDEIGARMRNAMLNVAPNPLGVLFNPASIAKAITLALTENPSLTLRNNNGAWHCMQFSSSFSALTREECNRNCQEALRHTREFLSSADYLILTFGTSWIYRLNGEIVGNCHKLPGNLFQRETLEPDEIVEIISECIRSLRNINPAVKVIFTVSPVRHVADTLHGNNLSKARLLLAVERLTDTLTDTAYFPAYEMLIDDLRDYRFYASDLAHPAQPAIDYVWENFCRDAFSEQGRKFIAEAEQLRRRINHRPLVEGTEADIAFRNATDRLLSEFLHRHPFASI